jgi:hypothetical protein
LNWGKGLECEISTPLPLDHLKKERKKSSDKKSPVSENNKSSKPKTESTHNEQNKLKPESILPIQGKNTQFEGTYNFIIDAPIERNTTLGLPSKYSPHTSKPNLNHQHGKFSF